MAITKLSNPPTSPSTPNLGLTLEGGMNWEIANNFWLIDQYIIADEGGGGSGTSFGQSSVSYSATPTFNASSVTGFKITLAGNVTSSTFTNGVAGTTYVWEIIQNSTGGYTFVWPTNVKGGIALTEAALLPNETIVQSCYCDGTNAFALTPGMVNP